MKLIFLLLCISHLCLFAAEEQASQDSEFMKWIKNRRIIRSLIALEEELKRKKIFPFDWVDEENEAEEQEEQSPLAAAAAQPSVQVKGITGNVETDKKLALLAAARQAEADWQNRPENRAKKALGIRVPTLKELELARRRKERNS